MNTIGQNIKQHRKKSGLSQKELAYEIGVSPASIYEWENDKIDMYLMSFLKLCDQFNISPNELLGWEEENAETGSVQKRETFKYDNR